VQVNVLIICSGNVYNFIFEIHQAFIFDQINAINKINPNIIFQKFFIIGKGWTGYLRSFKKLKNNINKNNIDIIHAHGGLSGLLANFQRKIPVLTTFHGSDINIKKNRYLSAIAKLYSKEIIYVSKRLEEKSFFKNKKQNIIPCGINFGIFKPYDKYLCKKEFQLENDKKYILFASSFSNKRKNYELLKRSLQLFKKKYIKVLELKNFNRKQVARLMNAVDICVMTSYSEGSPQFIKEAMACNCPIVSTDVGDVREVIDQTEGCYITEFDAEDVAKKIRKALKFGKRTDGRNKVRRFDNKFIAAKVIKVYEKILGVKKDND
jgi:glycosyltransferase involved in cell wall biosynthesis